MAGLAVIDGDIVAYRCAAANETRSVLAVHNETADSVTFDTLTKFREWAGDEASNYTVTPHQEAGKIEHAYKSMRQMIQTICDKAGCDSYHIVTSGSGNFRLELPLPTRYKDARKESTKPLQLHKCKTYLIEHHGAEVSSGEEADDVLVAYAVQGYNEYLKDITKRVVQCSLDKDAKHGPGWLFDWTTMDEPILIEGFGELELILTPTGKKLANGEPQTTKSVKGKGRIWLYYQMVFGDPVDCYKPCELAKAKFGEVGAYDLLKNCKTDKEALEALVAKYKLWYPKPVTYRAWDEKMYTKDWLEIWQMYADCAFMRRWEGDRFDVKVVLDKMKIEY